jgi:hypothetical protein
MRCCIKELVVLLHIILPKQLLTNTLNKNKKISLNNLTYLAMIKLISKENPSILAFRVYEEINIEDVDWIVKRSCKRHDHTHEDVMLYLEFVNFGEMTVNRMWEQFKMFVEHLFELMKNVGKIALVTSNVSLREKLQIEFALVPTIRFKPFHADEKEKACKWLEKI